MFNNNPYSKIPGGRRPLNYNNSYASSADLAKYMRQDQKNNKIQEQKKADKNYYDSYYENVTNTCIIVIISCIIMMLIFQPIYLLFAVIGLLYSLFSIYLINARR